jgi:hypothetical protein
LKFSNLKKGEKVMEKSNPIERMAVAILEGRVPATDPFLAHMAERAQIVSQEGIVLIQEVQEAEKHLSALRQKLVGTRGAIQKYVQDAVSWMEKMKKNEEAEIEDANKEEVAA